MLDKDLGVVSVTGPRRAAAIVDFTGRDCCYLITLIQPRTTRHAAETVTLHPSSVGSARLSRRDSSTSADFPRAYPHRTARILTPTSYTRTTIRPEPTPGSYELFMTLYQSHYTTMRKPQSVGVHGGVLMDVLTMGIPPGKISAFMDSIFKYSISCLTSNVSEGK
ncbi:hypothetical protein Bbelb_274800 [Branchiostoma belcheri]|nr:hypothetical protein Bbelb_274800 [Branchiostoma belcheri]